MTDLSKLTDAELFDLYKAVREEIFEKRTEYTPLSAKDLDEVMEQEREKEREKAEILAKANNEQSVESIIESLTKKWETISITYYAENFIIETSNLEVHDKDLKSAFQKLLDKAP